MIMLCLNFQIIALVSRICVPATMFDNHIKRKKNFGKELVKIWTHRLRENNKKDF